MNGMRKALRLVRDTIYSIIILTALVGSVVLGGWSVFLAIVAALAAFLWWGHRRSKARVHAMAGELLKKALYGEEFARDVAAGVPVDEAISRLDEHRDPLKNPART